MPKLKPYIIGAAAGVGLMLVFGAAGVLAYKKAKPLAGKIIAKLGDMRYAGVKKAAQEFLIADFESPEDFRKFEAVDAEVDVAREFVTRGAYAARATFRKSKAPALRLEKYLEHNRGLTDWSFYGSFLCDITNPQDGPQRLVLQIKDRRGRRYKQDIHLEPKSTETIEVEVSLLRRHISVYQIAGVSLFQWEPQAAAVFYLDNIRLAPERAAASRKTIFDPEFTASSEPAYAAGDYFYFPAAKWATDGGRVSFPLRVVNATSVRVKDFPARGGIPFPKGGLLSQDNLVIRDQDGQEVPHQARTMALWPDGSIKWLRVDLRSSAPAVYSATYPAKTRRAALPLLATESKDRIAVDTGKIKFSVGKKQFRLFDKVWCGGREVVSDGSDLTLRFRGNVYRASWDRDVAVVLEENGPLVAGIRAEGWFVAANRKKFCKFVVRVKAYKNESFVRVYHTLIYTGYPENIHHYLYKGMRLPKNETVGEVALGLRLPEVIPGGIATFGADGAVLQRKDLRTSLKLLQTRDDLFQAVAQERLLGSGRKLEGWLDVASGDKGLCVVVRKLWQQYPKAFEIDAKNRELVVKLWPSEAGELDLRTTEKTPGPEDVARGSAFGLGKTHEMVFYFHEGGYKEARAREMAWVSQEPPLVTADPAWFSDTRVLGAVADSLEGRAYFKAYEDVLERLFGWAVRQKKEFRWYGMLSFGDTLSWWRREAYDKSYDDWGWHPEGRWGWFNCEGAGTHTGALLQFLRTGDYRYFEFGEDLARHIMDVDTCHFNTVAHDRRLRRLFEDYSRPGSMHRHSGDHWGGRNEEASHTNLGGILLYYYLTGYDRALDVAREIGEFFLKHPITYFKHPDIAPHRAMANILWGETMLYEATRDERLKKDADEWANLFFQGQNRNGGFNENYNPVRKKWEGDPHTGYMSGYTLPALIAYHKMTLNSAIAEAVVRLTEYLAKHDEYGSIFEGLAYSYFLTGEKKFLEETEKRLDSMLGHQRTEEDPRMNGMIYQKAYYARVVDFLSFAPYAFEALLSSQEPHEESR